MVAGRLGELGAERAADARAEGALPGVDAFQQRALVRRPRRAAAEFVGVLELLEELTGSLIR